MQHGKDTICSILKKNITNKNVVRLGFADPLKKEIARACGVTVEHIDENKPLFRPILQWWGTDFRRGQNKNYWIQQWAKAAACYTSDDVVVVPDVRFQNEAEIIQYNGGHLWRVVRPAIDAIKYEQGNHASEQLDWHSSLQVPTFINREGELGRLEREVMAQYGAIGHMCEDGVWPKE